MGKLMIIFFKLIIKTFYLQKGAQLNISIIDRDPDDIDDVIDYFSISINISAGSLLTSNFTGVYNYIQLELTIEVTCTQSNMDGSCITKDCTAVPCKNGRSCVAGSCSCSPGYTGDMCELGMIHLIKIWISCM